MSKSMYGFSFWSFSNVSDFWFIFESSYFLGYYQDKHWQHVYSAGWQLAGLLVRNNVREVTDTDTREKTRMEGEDEWSWVWRLRTRRKARIVERCERFALDQRVLIRCQVPKDGSRTLLLPSHPPSFPSCLVLLPPPSFFLTQPFISVLFTQAWLSVDQEER